VVCGCLVSELHRDLVLILAIFNSRLILVLGRETSGSTCATIDDTKAPQKPWRAAAQPRRRGRNLGFGRTGPRESGQKMTLEQDRKGGRHGYDKPVSTDFRMTTLLKHYWHVCLTCPAVTKIPQPMFARGESRR
jgi:hypothetical protein